MLIWRNFRLGTCMEMAKAKITGAVPKELSLVGPTLDAFYESASVPVHLRNLLKIYGIHDIGNLEYLDEESITALEDGIKDGTLIGTFVDMSSKQDQKRYFGALIVNFQTWRFSIIERKILQNLRAKSTTYLKAEAVRAAKQGKVRFYNKQYRLKQSASLTINSSSEDMNSRDSTEGPSGEGSSQR